MSKNINEDLHKECVRRLDQFEQRTAGLPGPLYDFVALFRVFDERLQELERKK